MRVTKREIAVIVLIALLMAGTWMLVGRIQRSNDGAQNQFVYDAVHNAALACYAVEGAYPTDLAYLRENYGLAYDENRYLVVYNAFSSNLVPEISVFEMEEDA